MDGPEVFRGHELRSCIGDSSPFWGMKCSLFFRCTWLWPLCIGFILAGCQRPGAVGCQHEADRDSILERMATQEVAWNRGDLEAFMEPYWKSDSLLFVGSRGPTRGWTATLDNYRKGYPDKSAMGRLTFGVESVDFPSCDVALMLGSWRLDERGELESLSGWFSLVWERMDGRWVIVRDHSS